MGAPVTAQRTNAPGRTTRKSPSRYLTSASPAIGDERSKRLSKIPTSAAAASSALQENIVFRGRACHREGRDAAHSNLIATFECRDTHFSRQHGTLAEG